MRRAAALAAVAALAGAAPAHAAPTITMSGSYVTRPLIADLAYFYRHSVPDPPRFALAGGVTATGIADTERGVVDAGMVVRALGPGDPSDLVLTRLALSGVCLVTNLANPVPAMTRAQVQDVVAGRVTSWSQVPGSRRTDAIVPIGLEPGAGTWQVFVTAFVDITTPMAYRPITLATDLQARDYIEQTPGALGYLDLSMTAPVHVMRYEGTGCTRAAIRSGAYPAARPLGIVTRGRPRGELARFLRWVQTSRVARRVIATRYLPV
jgi:phosphate transport system substrate-binding protein